MSFIPSEIIKRKRDGRALSDEEIKKFILAYAKGDLPDYQMSALLMAIFLNGMSESETLSLTETMLRSGDVVNFENFQTFKVDKHSTGGVGDKTSLILGPVVASLGVAVPMISGRGLGHTGGTLDKLESIPGFNTQFSLEQFVAAVKKHNICFIGQTQNICPADKKIYALRDVTGTVESLPLICASIMSKKLAEGIDALVLDVKYGSGAFMKTSAQAEELALALMKIATGYGKKVSALLTNMDQPLGQFAGNSVEVDECVRILRGEKIAPDTLELSLQLSAQMLFLAGQGNLQHCYQMAQKSISSGQAYEKFEELCVLHGGRLKELPTPKNRIDLKATASGFVQKFETEKIGIVGIKIKAGRAVTSDKIEPTAGLEFHKKVGDPVSAGDLLFSLYGADKTLLESVQAELLGTVKIENRSIEKPPLIFKALAG